MHIVIDNEASSVTLTEKQRKQFYYAELLRNEGYCPRVVDAGLIAFKYQGITMFIDIDVKDRQFVSVVYPQCWRIQNVQERRRAILVANALNTKIKVAKVFLIRGGSEVWAAAELFLATPENFQSLLGRSTAVLWEAGRQIGCLMSSMKSGGVS